MAAYCMRKASARARRRSEGSLISCCGTATKAAREDGPKTVRNMMHAART